MFRADKEPDLKGLPPAYELTWNHTTLRAIRVDPTITYLQTRYPFPDHLAHVQAMVKRFGDEVPSHLEFIRFDGSIGAAGLPLVRFTTVERLDEIIRIHEDNGCWIFNPHRYTLEEGGMKQTDEVQLAFKREVDPARPAQPRQDDRLGEPRLRFPDRQAVPVQRFAEGILKACDPSRFRRPRGSHERPRPPRSSRRNQLQCGAASADHRAAVRQGPQRRRLRSLRRGFRSADDAGRAARLSRRADQRRKRARPMSSGC